MQSRQLIFIQISGVEEWNLFRVLEYGHADVTSAAAVLVTAAAAAAAVGRY
jgi:hypothetical protein